MPGEPPPGGTGHDPGEARPGSLSVGTRRAGVWLLVGLVLYAGLTADVLVGGDVSETVDPRARDVFRQESGPLRVAASILTHLGSLWLLSGLVLVETLTLSAWRLPRHAAGLVGGSVGIVLLVESSKALVGRARPGTLEEELSAFPSGHAANGLVVWTLLLVLLLDAVYRRDSAGKFSSREGLGFRVAFGTAGVVGFLLGLTRVVLDVHWLSDVVAGWSLGAAYLGGFFLVWNRWGPDGPLRNLFGIRSRRQKRS